jgi:hypothetical protein
VQPYLNNDTATGVLFNFSILSGWLSLTPSRAVIGKGVVVQISGFGFDRPGSYVCSFSKITSGDMIPDGDSLNANASVHNETHLACTLGRMCVLQRASCAPCFLKLCVWTCQHFVSQRLIFFDSSSRNFAGADEIGDVNFSRALVTLFDKHLPLKKEGVESYFEFLPNFQSLSPSSGVAGRDILKTS